MNQIKKVFLARTRDEKIWKNSSSGGIFWSFVENMIINKKGICYGAKYTEDFNVIHDRACTLEEAKSFRGSKYVQSDMKNCFELILNDLNNGNFVLFSGTPCQVQAVKNFVPANLQDKLILIEILCHGVPSPQILKDYILFQEKVYNSKVSEISFRGKKLKNSVQDMYIKFKSGKKYKSFGTQDIFYNFYFHEFISRESCSSCPFADKKRAGDITISDYWGDYSKVPKVFNDMEGLSCVYINTKKGELWWSECSNNLLTAEVSLDVCDQVVLNHPIAEAKNKDDFWCYYSSNGIKKTYEKFFEKYSKTVILRFIKNFLNQTGLLEIIHKIKKTGGKKNENTDC